MFKVLLQSKAKQIVFIDSDDLKELDQLFDIAKCKVRRLVVYLTRDTLTRPWCAGEVFVEGALGVIVNQNLYGTRRLTQAALELLGKLRYAGDENLALPNTPGMLISADPDDDEAVVASGILVSQVAGEV